MKRKNKLFIPACLASGILLSSCISEIYNPPPGNTEPAEELSTRSNTGEEKIPADSSLLPDPDLICCDLVDRRENPTETRPVSIERGEKAAANQERGETPLRIEITISNELLSSGEPANFILITIRESALLYDPDSDDIGSRTSRARIKIVPDLDFTLPSGKIPYLNIHCYLTGAI